MKPQKCIFIVNTKNGYCFTPTEHKSISDAMKTAKDSCGFAYRIFANNKVVKRGFCD